MELASVVRTAAMTLGIKPRALSGMDLVELYNYIYMQYGIVIEIVHRAHPNQPSRFNFAYRLMRGFHLPNEDDFHIEELKSDQIDTCNMVVAIEHGFVEAVNYINTNGLNK